MASLYQIISLFDAHLFFIQKYIIISINKTINFWGTREKFSKLEYACTSTTHYLVFYIVQMEFEIFPCVARYF